ncbi:SPFH domain-containing protein [Millisia brevis]|uniref:SPFH domain-containing protein n=1 Tax=Millisia brevis TaxID=264148 RepID=UPI00082A44BF|nr:SPFH domain-containing protein [Millisia brevis]
MAGPSTTVSPSVAVDVDMPEPQVRERVIEGANGFVYLTISLAVLLVGLAVGGYSLYQLAEGSVPVGLGLLAIAIVALLAALVIPIGLTPVAPGEARVVQLFGRYRGTLRESGFRWVNPFTVRTKVSTRIRNHETEMAKVNDADGSPIEIAAVVVWQVLDTARASFEVDDFVEFVAIQSETAVRHIATKYPYDSNDPQTYSLRDNADEITTELSAEIAARVESAGVKIIESRITRLSYAPEIAQAMLRRQQAGAVIAARERIVEGAVGMVKSALDSLAAEDVVDLDEERRAAMVSNLLVVLCSDSDTQPVINTGSLYQ